MVRRAGLYSDEQVAGWNKIIEAVHAKGGRMFSQLWHTGRSSHVDDQRGNARGAFRRSGLLADSTPSVHAERLGQALAASGARYFRNPGHRRGLSQSRRAAKAAGFDGVELHAANGYLPDEFLQDGSNKRTDTYGGSVENRSRFLLEVVEAMVSVWGGNRVAVRIGPGGTWNGMSDTEPRALFDYVAEQLNRFGLAYLHVVERGSKATC